MSTIVIPVSLYNGSIPIFECENKDWMPESPRKHHVVKKSDPTVFNQGLINARRLSQLDEIGYRLNVIENNLASILSV